MSRQLRRIDQRITDTRLADLRRDLVAADEDRQAGRPYPSQYELARRCGVSQTFVSLVKNGKRRPPATTLEAA